MKHHLRGPTSRLARLRVPCTVLGTMRRWSTFALADPASPATLAAALGAPIAQIDASERGTTAVFVTSDGWRAEVRVGLDEPAAPVDHALLETLVRRRILTTIQRVRLAAKLRARARVRAAWLATNGLEVLLGFAEAQRGGGASPLALIAR
jgi:hypothetical protein